MKRSDEKAMGCVGWIAGTLIGLSVLGCVVGGGGLDGFMKVINGVLSLIDKVLN